MFRKKAAKLIPLKPVLPILPDYRGMNLVDWTLKARPIVNGLKRNITYTKFWEDIYYDNITRLLILAARQVWKTTAATDFAIWYITTKFAKEIAYIVDTEARLSASSKQRFRDGTIEQNPNLKQFIEEMNYSTISTKLKSTLYMLTDQGGFNKIEGKSLYAFILDETQYQELDNIHKLYGAQSSTFGREIYMGIGGEAGSPWHMKWQETDQREYTFKYNGQYKGHAHQEWRSKLKFWGKSHPVTGKIINELEDGEIRFGESRLILGPYLKDVTDGRWIPETPSHGDFHGYHIKQEMMYHIPLTIVDAKELYGIGGHFSLEYKKKEWLKSIYTTDVLAEFHKAPRRPLTREDILLCMEPYSNMRLLQPEEVQELKKHYGNNIIVSMGIDWGSGPTASKCVCAIMIYWKKTGLFQLVHIEWREREDQRDQAPHFVELFNMYGCDIGIADIGYGQHQIKDMQDGNYHRQTGDAYAGLGINDFIACRTISDPAKPYQFYDAVTDQHGDTVSEIRVDKTRVVDDFADLINSNVMHPNYMNIKPSLRPKLIIPYKIQDDVDWLIDDWVQLMRKDLPKLGEVIEADNRTTPRKEYSHPPDSMMACIYSVLGAYHKKGAEWFYISG